ncbi:uncharacterized protein PSFLO_06997 [Pseudozyma flocculosa]|uniref:Major facilitator superfamily (MFS) profile domain-containing protein n=1 Tax=Pseudozyma flocculosa TaxID=84751 RepID=A0A5C3FCV7_9BASI|nr:uncharacterized protein PSFLO_06997 [Pseudozyma flocculosa]
MVPTSSSQEAKEASSSRNRRERGVDASSATATRSRQLSAAQFQARTAAAAAAAAKAQTPNALDQTIGRRRRSSTLVASGLVAEEDQVSGPSAGPGAGPSTLRHPSGNVARITSLNQVSEGVFESESPRYKRSRLQNASAQVDTREPIAAEGAFGRDGSRTVPTEALSRALPRGFNPDTGRVSEQRTSRPSLPFIFSEDRGPYLSPLSNPIATPSAEFPNPHTPGTGARLREDDRAASKEVGVTQRTRAAATAAAAIQQQPQSEWSSDASSPTPTASSVAADLARRERAKVELIPIRLVHPSSFAATQAAPLPAIALTPAKSPEADTGPIVPQKAAVQASAGPATSQAKVEGRQPTQRDMVVKAGPQVPLVRNDLQNLKRISASAVRLGSSSKPASLRSPNSQTESGTTLAATASGHGGAASHGVPAAISSPPPQTTESTFGRLPHAPPAARPTEGASNTKLLSVGGHVLGTSKATLLSRKDGTARPIYSPTPLTVAAAVQQQDRTGHDDQRTGAEDRLAPLTDSALPASTVAPPAPQLPHNTRFEQRGDPEVASPNVRQPLQVSGNARGFDDSRRATLGVAQPSDEQQGQGNNVGSPDIDSDLLREANRRLFLYQQQQQQKEELDKRKQGDAFVGIESTADLGTKEAPQEAMQRHPSGRRDSVDSASTAFEAEDVGNAAAAAMTGGTTMAKTLSDRQAEKRRSISREGPKLIAGGLVAPPSDVPEAKEPSSEGSRSHHRDLGHTDHGDDADSESYLGTRQTQQLIIDTADTRADESRGRSDFRFIPILNVHAAGGKNRPRTGNTRVSFRSGHSRDGQGHGQGRLHNAPACRQCFRAGFDCAMNLHLGEGTMGRKAFQDFVAAGGLNALSIRDGVVQDADGSIYDNNITVGDALGRNYVDKLGEVAFGESALSRPVTRGMMHNLLEEKQEKEFRGRLVSDHRPWSSDEQADDADAIKEVARPSVDGAPQEDYGAAAQAPRQQDRRLSQATLRNEPTALIARNLKDGGFGPGSLPATLPKADIDPADFDSLSDRTASDDLDFLPDRWPLWRKLLQMLVLGVYAFALQALDSGYTEAIPQMLADFRPGAPWDKLIGLGMLCFNGSQAGGLMLGCLLVSFGRQRIVLVTLVIVGAICVIAGFTSAVAVMLVLEYLLGQVAGVVLFLVAATLVDIFDTYTTRLVGLMMLIFAVATGQLAGPWIARLIIAQASWSWQFWAMLAFAGVMIVVIGICTRETNASVLFRRHVQTLRREQGLWTPDPQPEPTWTQVLAEDGVRPFRVLFSSWTLPLLSVTTIFFLGVFVFMYAAIDRVFVDVHGLSPTMGALASTVSGVVGVLWAVFALLVVDSRINGAPDLRTLHIDEKGYIDASKAERKTERVLIGALLGAGLFSLSLYTLALTSQMDLAWIFTAFGVVMHTAGLIMVVVSALQYALDSFSPARTTKIQDVTAREEPPSTPPSVSPGARTNDVGAVEDPYTTVPQRRSLVRRESDDTVSSMSRRDKRWANETALAAFAVLAGLTVMVANVLYLPSTTPSETISFQAFAVIFASASLVAVAGPVLLYIYGGRARQAAVAKLDHDERARAHRRAARRRERGHLEDGNGRGQSTGPRVSSARASRVVPWISKCLSGDTIITNGTEADAARIRARAEAQAQGYLVGGGDVTVSPAGSVHERTRRKELFLGRILAERAQQDRVGGTTTPLRPRSTSRSHLRHARTASDSVVRPSSRQVERFEQQQEQELASRPLTPVMPRNSRDLSRINLLETSLDAAIDFPSTTAAAAQGGERADGKYWTRGHARNATHDGSRARVVGTGAGANARDRAETRRDADGKGRFDLWVS